MMIINGFDETIVYSRLWERDDEHFFLMYIDAFKLYDVLSDNKLNLSVDPVFAMTQNLPMELFDRTNMFAGYMIETLGDHATGSNTWVEKIYDFGDTMSEENFDDLVEQGRSSINVKNLFFTINLEFLNNSTKNHFKLKHTRFLLKTP